MSSSQVESNPHIPQRDIPDITAWLLEPLPLGFFSMAPRDHHHVSSSAFCQWIKDEPFYDPETGFHMGGLDGVRWAVFSAARMLEQLKERRSHPEKYKHVEEPLALDTIQVYIDVAVSTLTKALQGSYAKLSAERNSAVDKPDFVSLNAVPSTLSSEPILGFPPPDSSRHPSPASPETNPTEAPESEDEPMDEPERLPEPPSVGPTICHNVSSHLSRTPAPLHARDNLLSVRVALQSCSQGCCLRPKEASGAF